MRNVTKTLKTLMLFAVSMFVFVSFGFAQQTMLVTESFETGTGTTPPTGWSLEQVTGTALGVSFVTTSTNPTISAAYDGVRFVQYNSYSINSGSTRLKRTAVSTTNKSFIMVDFAWFEDPGYTANADKVDVQWSINGTTWNTAGTFNRYNAVAGWKTKNVVLPTGANNQATLYVAFLFTSAYGNNCALDLVHVTAGPAAPPAFATIGTGTVSSNYPYTTYWMGGRTQMLYTAAELTAAGATAGNLSSVGFNVIAADPATMNGFNVKLGATALTTLSAGYVAGLTSYYTTPYAVPGTGWRNITLTTPFIWNGTSNVIVEICYANTSYTNYSTVYSTTLTSMCAGHYADLQTECTVATNNAPTSRPNIRFGIPPINPGVLMGYVKDVNTLAPIAGAIVQIGAARDTSRANGMYIIYNLNAGSVTANATATGYISGTGTATIVTGVVTNLDILLAPGPKVGGTVTDASTGLPIVGATVTVGTGASAVTTLTITGGTYLTPLLSLSGAQPVVIGKTGYDDCVNTVTLVPNTTATQNCALLPTAIQPGPFTAVLNNPTTPTAVNLNWGVPQGLYQVIYDDGTQDNFAIWATAKNLNAMKFTPLNWPVKLIGGKVNLGVASNYPANALPLVKFQMLAMKADGAGGLPGTIIDSVDVTPTGFGWADFSFATPLTINSGDFYLVMKQGGIPPHAAGIGVDLTNTQLRSYSKFVTGGAPWIPAAGNFMLRAILQGTGGPMLSDNPSANKELITAGAVNGLIYESPVATVTGHEGVADYSPMAMSYQVWRLLQGQEGNQALWTSIWTGSVNTTVDNGWPTLPNGAYRWAVKAIYSPPGQRPSAPTFSNVIGKGWIANVNVCVSLTCVANPKAGSIVKLVNTNYPDTNYTKTTDTAGCVHFTGVWKGTYVMTVTRFTYPVYTQNVTILGDANYNIMLLQDAAPPTNLVVNDQSLHASWSPPRAMVYQLDENFATGFATNAWVVSGGTNWQMSAGTGNPAPSAFFNWTPTVSNYDQYLTSKSLAGVHAPQMKFKYDIFLDNYGTTNLNTMAVELWNGTTWTVLKTYDNSSGANIPWTSETLDITSQTHNPAFKVRFHAAGVNSVDIDGWYVDNVKIVSSDGTTGPNPCVIGYNFYLNGTQSAFTPDTTYNIPPNQVVYGQTYQACVKAVYGSGYSPQICVTFTAHFLYPARDLTATGIECNAYLTWKKPVTVGDAPNVPMFDGVVEHSQSHIGLAPKNPAAVVSTMPTDAPLGSNAFGIDCSSHFTINFDVNNVAGKVNIAGTPNTTDFWHDLEMPANQTDFGYAIMDGSDHLFKVIRATGAFTDLGSMGNGTTDQMLDLAIDGSNGDVYGISSASLTTDKLWKINPAVPSATLVGTTVNSAGMISMAGDQLGNLWGYDLVNDRFYSINKTTGLATVVGPLGFDANYGQCMFYDQAVNTITMAAYNNTAGAGQIRAVDVTTGGSTLLSSTPDQIGGATLPVTTAGGGGGTPVGLVGYNIYRDGAFIHRNPHQDSITYYDYGRDPGTYKYDVKARYDLTSYGFPGQFGESLTNTAGEQTVTLNCGAPLPFSEPWDIGTFAFQNWSPVGHWTMNTGIGNPAPCADFTWQPAIANYSQELKSEVIDASAWTCAAIWLDFDLKLIDRNNTGKEKLTIDLYYNNSWHQKLEVTNNGSTNWIPKHIDISSVKGKSFRIRFVANGVNSADILHWYVDNIHAYGICKAPAALHAVQSQFTTTLTWTAPNCGSGTTGQIMNFVFDDGTAESGVTDNGEVAWLGTEFPISNAYDGVLKQFKIYWMANAAGAPFTMKVDVYSAAHVLLGSSANFQMPSDDWVTVTAPDIPFAGPFYAMVKFDNNPTATNYLGWDNNGPYATQDLGWYRDAAGVWAKLSTFGLGIGTGCFVIQAQALVGADLKSVTLVPGAQTVPGTVVPANKLTMTNRHADTHYHGVMGIETDAADSSTLNGYNVYRTDATGVAPYAMLNTSPVTAATYVDTYPTTLVAGTFRYYVTSLYKNSANNQLLCESSSDTVLVHFPATGLNDLTSGQIMVYPNPASELVNIKSDYTITAIDAMNFVGQTVYTSRNVDSKTAQLNVTSFKTGVYFVKVSTTEGIRTVKITVTH
ncbi:MAG: T9SS type A sorting domain-containing protein [Bacteroidetes bacterium]|nr:T9SS type A sorting domain-containing protein [Bacteroidota bacterium]